MLNDVASRLRTLAGLSSLIPVAGGSLAVGLVTHNRRNAVNFFTDTWPQLMLRMSGVDLNITGVENLVSARPAVFIFNHRNNFDVMIAASLVGDNWTSVGKKELENDPIAGTIGRIVDAAFIDREDPVAAVEGLQKVEELASKGLSVIIAPEGTRTGADTVGPFKKGPFRIAMSARIPIVCIVIRNANEVADRHGSVLRPGVVDVRVLPPMSVANWTLDDLDARIAAVRELYVGALTSWPGPAGPSGASTQGPTC